MSSKSQRKKERHEQKRKDKRKQQVQSRPRQDAFGQYAEHAVGSNARHRQRLSRQIPRAWPGEISEDVAVFEDAALSLLSPELAAQTKAIRESLQDALESRGEIALNRMSTIPRGSPLSEWRLFIRGLVDWLANRSAAADEAWRRLDPQRRPGRIAMSMSVALRSDLEKASPQLGQEDQNGLDHESQTSHWTRFDAQQLYHAKLLRRVRFDRAALQIAQTGLSIPEESKELLLGPRKVEWLKRFVEEYGDTEPDLANALAQTALGRAFSQNFCDLFDDAIRKFQGPRHDRRNRLLTFFYYTKFEDDSAAERKANQALLDYLNRDLPQNEALSLPLRGAIASQIHLSEAMALMAPPRGNSMIDRMFAAPEDTKAIRNHLRAAVKADPANGPAYKAHIDWINSKLDDDRLTKREQMKLEEELPDLMRSWSQATPEEVEPRLWLVDYLLENEQMDEARPHVDFLAASRQDDPRVRATPWKWQLLEAMRLCRRKAWLADVPARLDEAEALWPAWLSKQWLPYLRAAWTLRSGQADAFEEERRRICEQTSVVRDSLTDACMMLGAAQLMRVPATGLEPFRQALDRALKGIKALPLEDLLDVGGFFWDMHRVKLVYPAYRMHGKTIGKELFARLNKSVKLVRDGINDERIHKSVLWGSECRFWPNYNDMKLPALFSNREIQRHPIFAAATLNALLKERYPWGIDKHRELAPLLRDAALSERNAYYRHWFTQLANELDEGVASQAARFSGFPFGNPFGTDDDDDDDDSLEFDPDCDCAKCQAARKAREQASSSRNAPF